MAVDPTATTVFTSSGWMPKSIFYCNLALPAYCVSSVDAKEATCQPLDTSRLEAAPTGVIAAPTGVIAVKSRIKDLKLRTLETTARLPAGP